MQQSLCLASVALGLAAAACGGGLPPIESVEIGEQREFRVNGRPFFPLMLWLQSEARIPDGLSVGVNTFCGNGGHLSRTAYLDELAAKGLYGVVQFDPACVGHSHLLGWIHGDEPDLPAKRSDAQIQPAKHLRINRKTPLYRILDGVTHSWSVLDPMEGAELTIRLPRPVTVHSIAVHATVSKGLAVAKKVAFLGDGKPILEATLEKKKGRQEFDLTEPATFQELTFRVLSATPGEHVWGSIGELEAFDADHENVLLSVPRTVPRHSVEEVAEVYRRIKAAAPARPVFMTLTAYFMDCFEKYDEATKQRLYPRYVEHCDVVGYDIYPIFGWNKPEWLGRVADGVSQLRAIAGPRRPVYAWIETNVGSRWVSPEAQKPLTPRHTRAEVWMAIIRGATAIGYFTHQWRPKYRQFAPTEEMRAELKRLNDQITRLAPAILAPPAGVEIEVRMGDRPTSHFKATRLGDQLTLFVQNMHTERREARIAIEGLQPGATVEVVDEDRTRKVSGNHFVDGFPPLAEHIYRIPF
ncbi:MAG: hypothetical protein ACLF0G_12735 [Candidatus Brocadiia bacterium]